MGKPTLSSVSVDLETVYNHVGDDEGENVEL